MMPPSSPTPKQSAALALKQAANWQCASCGRMCRHTDESLGEFAARIGQDIDVIEAHPRRWTLHVTKLLPADSAAVAQQSDGAVVLCGSCHGVYHNQRRWQHHRRQRRRQQEQIGQLTLRDICLPLAGLQLSLSEWGTPYEIVNPQPRKRRLKSPRTGGGT
ncbi:MAG: hypothetical protein AAGI45_17465 [Cyanobacteria bacterium P01_H01_bin.26]